MNTLRGLNDFFEELTSKSYKIQNRVMLSRYRGKTICNTCKGKRLRPEASYVKINGTSLQELVELPLEKVTDFFKNLELNEVRQRRLLKDF